MTKVEDTIKGLEKIIGCSEAIYNYHVAKSDITAIKNAIDLITQQQKTIEDHNKEREYLTDIIRNADGYLGDALITLTPQKDR